MNKASNKRHLNTRTKFLCSRKYIVLFLFTCFCICFIYLANLEKGGGEIIPKSVSSRCIQSKHIFNGVNDSSETHWNCLPQYLGIGFPKCGSSSIWRYLKQHPKISLYRRGKTKEAHFFHEPPDIVRQSLQSYMRQFPALPTTSIDDFTIGEHTPGYIWRVPYRCSPHSTRMGCWGDRSVGTSISSTALTISSLIPKVKLLVSMRNPTDRAYSHFWHFAPPCYTSKPKRDPQCFHTLALQQMSDIRACEDNATNIQELSGCAWGDTQSADAWFLLPRMLSLGLYARFLSVWSQHFPSSSFCVITLEQLASNRTHEMTFIEQCIGVPHKQTPYTDEKVNRRGSVAPVMPNSTRTVLDDFYEPYNKLLLDFDFMDHALQAPPHWLRV